MWYSFLLKKHTISSDKVTVTLKEKGYNPFIGEDELHFYGAIYVFVFEYNIIYRRNRNEGRK